MPRIRNSEGRYACDQPGCGITHPHLSNLLRHHKLHLAKPYMCEQGKCWKLFASADELGWHNFRHSNEDKPYRCHRQGCGKSFGRRWILENHVASVHGEERNFCCAEAGCGAAFKTPGDLRKHISQVHVGRPHACPEPGCDVAFKTAVQLAMHGVVHSGARPHSCKQCSAAFTQPSALRQHIREQHSEQRLHRCTVDGCGAAFKRPWCLSVHMRVHTNPRAFACPVDACESTFNHKSTLDKHLRVIHAVDQPKGLRKQEERVERALREAGIDFAREHRVAYECWKGTWSQADFLIVENGGVIIVEVDERQHSDHSYTISCDTSRMGKMHQAFMLDGNTLPVAFLRYNPDAFKVDGVTKRTTKKEREARLLDVIRNWQHGPPGSLSVQYMFYDAETVNEKLQPLIWGDPEYDETMKLCCRSTIV